MLGAGVSNNYTLANNVEILSVNSNTSFGAYYGNASDNTIVYNESYGGATFSAVLDGKEGADHYIYVGGMAGRYITVYLDNAGDTWELRTRPYESTARAAVFNIVSSLNTDFTFDATIRQFQSIGTQAIAVIGNQNNNIIWTNTNSAANTLIGGQGDDTYHIGKV